MLYVVHHINGKKSYCGDFSLVRKSLGQKGPGRVTLLSATREEIDARIEELLNGKKERNASA